MKIHRDELYASKEMIDSEVYFSESIKWYNDIFVLPSVLRIVYVIFLVISVSAIYIIAQFTNAMMPIKTKMYTVIKTDRDPGTHIKLVSLKGYDNPFIGVLMYSIRNYINNRESYMFDDETVLGVVNKKNYFVRNTSSRDVYRKFMDNNAKPNSDMNRLISKNQETTVQILSIKLRQQRVSWWEKVYDYFTPVNPPSSAQIDFSKTSANVTSKWRVDISYEFKLSDASSSMRQAHAPIPFVVTQYLVRRVQDKNSSVKNKDATASLPSS